MLILKAPALQMRTDKSLRTGIKRLLKIVNMGGVASLIVKITIFEKLQINRRI